MQSIEEREERLPKLSKGNESVLHLVCPLKAYNGGCLGYQARCNNQHFKNVNRYYHMNNKKTLSVYIWNRLVPRQVMPPNGKTFLIKDLGLRGIHSSVGLEVTT